MRATPRPALMLAFALLVLGSAAPPTRGQQLVPGTWGTDGAVHSLARDGNTLYVGGNFTQVGPAVDRVSFVSAADGALIPGFPSVKVAGAGAVSVVVSDGSGGWYIGGSFTSVGGFARRNAARVLANGSVSNWDPSPDGPVSAIAVAPGLVYLGGNFQNCGGALRPNLAAVNSASGVATSWNPAPNGPVRALVLGATTIYVGGTFFAIAGVQRNGLAEILTSDTFPTGWFPSRTFGSQINCLLLDGDTMYIGGTFTNMGVGNDPRRNAAAVLTSLSGATATAWNPDVTNEFGFPSPVNAMAMSGGVIYLGGTFDLVGGQTRVSLVAVDKTAGAVTAFDAQLVAKPNFVPEVHALLPGTGGLHVGGFFVSSHGAPRANFVTVDAAGAPLAGWRCDAVGRVNALTASAGTLITGGEFALLGTTPRQNLAAIDLTTGRATDWDPGADASVTAIAPMLGRVYVGGGFANVGGQPRQRLAALDPVTGLAQGWNPGANNVVLALAVSGSNLYVGGGFHTIAGTARSYLASFDTGTGALRSWNPGAGANVSAILPQGTSVFVGGDGVLARFDGTTGLPNASGPAFTSSWGVQSLALDGGTLYVGGYFTSIGGAARDGLAAVDLATGNVTGWNPAPDINCGPNVCPPSVQALGVVGGVVYAGGGFETIGGATRPNFAALDPTTGLSLGGAIAANSTVLDMTVAADLVALGGSFMAVGGTSSPRLALLTPPPPLAAPPLASSSAVVLAAPSPNPMVERSQVRFALPSGTVVRLRLLDAAGRTVRSLLEDARLPAGPHEFPLRREGLAPGFYVLELRAGAERTTQPLVILR